MHDIRPDNQQLPADPPGNKAATRFLLIRLSSLGDIILATPAIRAIRTSYPDARIDFMVYDRFAAALAHHPDISRLLLLPKKTFKEQLKQGEYGRFARSLAGFIQELRLESYDYVIDLHNVTDSALAALCARGAFKAGHRKQILSLLFDKRSRFDIGFSTSPLHAAVANMMFLVDAGCIAEKDLPTAPRLEFFVPDEVPAAIDAYLASQQLTGRPLAGINPCASYEFKRWGVERFAAVADHISEKHGCVMLLFGSPAEQSIVRQVMAAMKSPAIDTSHLPLFEAFELIRRLRIFVTNDSAPMHIAAAFGTPVVALHGSINLRKFAPLSSHVRSMSATLPCLPCREPSRCTERLCFEGISIDDVSRACDELLLEMDAAAS